MADTVKQKKSTKRKAPPKAWKPGQSGNPNGRPKKGNAITDIIRELGDQKDRRRKILEKAYIMAEEGDKWAIKFIAEYDQGKPIQTTYTIEEKMEPIKGIDVS
jgi:hypothetical protein